MARRSDTPPVPTQSLESQHRDIPLKHGILPFIAGVLMGFCLAAMWLDHLDHQAFLQASTAAKPAE